MSGDNKNLYFAHCLIIKHCNVNAREMQQLRLRQKKLLPWFYLRLLVSILVLLNIFTRYPALPAMALFYIFAAG